MNIIVSSDRKMC